MNSLPIAILKNPEILLWIALACFGAGAASGVGGAWYIQGLRITALRAEYAGFVATTKAQGEAATKLAEFKIASDKRLKEKSDATYTTNLNKLISDNKRLRDFRSRGSFLPSEPGTAGSLKTACFDRAELERALQQFDARVSELAEEGDASTIGLNVAKQWVAELSVSERP